jgi:hypothetical protein
MLETDFEPERIEVAAELIERVYQEFVVELQQKAWLRQLVGFRHRSRRNR